MRKSVLFFTLIIYNLFSYSQNWMQTQKLVESLSDRNTDELFGYSVDISKNYVIIGAIDDANGVLNNTGAAYIFGRDSLNNWVEIKKLTASDGEDQDSFGWSVAISEKYAVISSIWDDEDSLGLNNLPESGSVYIFEKTLSGDWIEIQKIVASDREMGAEFGMSVGIDSNYIIIGSSSNNSAYIFQKSQNNSWFELQKITSIDIDSGDSFGRSVSIFGNTIVIGAWQEDEDENGNNTLIGSGSAYIFEKDSSNNWIQTKKLVASDRSQGDHFAKSISIDDNYIVIGAPNDKEDSLGFFPLSNAGSIYLFEKDSLGHWIEIQKIVASDREIGSEFGYSVSISKNYCIVGAAFDDTDFSGSSSLSNSGSVYIFQKDNLNNWLEIQKISASDRASGDNFGHSVGISDSLIIIGSESESDETGNFLLFDSGASYIFSLQYISSLKDELDLSKSLKIYPNPTSNQLNIISSETQQAEIEIYTIDGKLIEQKNIHKNTAIDVSKYQSGLYFIHATNSKGEVFRNKFVKE